MTLIKEIMEYAKHEHTKFTISMLMYVTIAVLILAGTLLVIPA